MKKNTIAFISVLVALGILLGALVYVYLGEGQSGYEDQNDDDTDPNIGLDLAPDFTLPKVGGGTLQLSSLRGKVVVLDFMATWCAPCATEIGHLKVVDGAYSDSQVEIISIDVDTNEGDALLAQYAAEKGITWPIVRDTLGISNAPGYEVSSIPTVVIVNQDGYIQYRNVGVVSSSELGSIIDGLLD